MAGSIAFAGPSARAGDETGDGCVSSQELVDALQNVEGSLAEDAFAPAATFTSPVSGTDGSEVSSMDGETDPVTLEIEIEIPEVAAEGVTMSVGEFNLGISLPNADKAARGESVADGIVTFPAEGASANAVIPTDRGVQLLTIIGSEDAPETYDYDLSLPAGHRLEATADGGARIVDEGDRTKVEFETAWAQDAASVNVPTRYSLLG
ncbi:hypothetical protein [Rhodoglobus vestalii]|uniref:hypothetical protein n=1 Tax=Rhodoglobus vestalii TaxID=193384 RepID=UPI0011538677|nr:hypothetical protein [Rhodoglobus vestalii]